MELDWSEQSAHIRTLYRPWQPGDGYEEATITAAETQLGIHLPTSLRTFYRAWGLRRDMTQMNNFLLGPNELVVRADAVFFCVENQATCSWAVRRAALEEFNPPIVVADALHEWEMQEIQSPLTWRPSHAHLSDFLDDFTYYHALCGGAIHGGFTEGFHHQEDQHAWLERHCHRITVGPMCFGMDVDATEYDLPFYVRDGQALAWLYGCSVAVREAESLDEISQALQITWVERW
jgi:hypothetical protein